jgi:hypothetical protein
VLLTRSPLGHPPEGGASLDLHVLSTPPAFVLSQDQTLREGLFDTDHEGRIVDTESHRPATVSITGSSELGVSFARCTKGISFTLRITGPWTRVIYMALTFGTLLSSQGADAHRHNRFRLIGGNPRYITRSASPGQTRPAPPGLPLGRGARRVFVPRAWGNIRPAPPVARPLGSAPFSVSVPRTTRTVVIVASRCKFRADPAAGPGFRASGPIGAQTHAA